MTMSPRWRKFALTAHVTSSVGWFGAIGAFLALAIAGLNSTDTQVTQAAYLAMKLTGWYVIVPLSLASVATGLIQSLGTSWGLLRHYWVLTKLLLTVVATGLLMLHMQVVDHVAYAAATGTLTVPSMDGMRVQLVADAIAALLVLLATAALSVYKPQGMTRYGQRKAHERRLRSTRSPALSSR